MSDTTVIELPDGAEMEVPTDAPRDEVRRRIGNYLKSLPKEQLDAVPTKARLAFGLGQGEVAAEARKRMANNLSMQTQNEYSDDMRKALQQGMRQVATPAVVGAVGLLTGGVGALPAMAAMAGTGGGMEYLAQTLDPSENAAGDIAKEMIISGAFEGVGRGGAAILRRTMAGRAAAKAARAATREATESGASAAVRGFSERVGVPLHVSSKPQQIWAGNAVATAVRNDADEIMRGFGGAETIEQAGQRASGVFQNIKDKFLDTAKQSRNFIVSQVGDVPMPLFQTKRSISEVARAAERRLGAGVDDALDVFFDGEKKALKDFTLDEFLALRTDIGSQASRAAKGSAKQTLLWKLYGGMTDDVEKLLGTASPDILTRFQRSSAQFAEYYGALKNEVFSRMFRAAESGNGTAVIRELMTADPSDIRAVMKYAHSMAPAAAGEFRTVTQRAALGQVFGISEPGAGIAIERIGQNLRKFGPDRLDEIFGWGQDGAQALKRAKELAGVVEHYSSSLKYAPSMVNEAAGRINAIVAKSAGSLVAKAAGFKYISMRLGYDALSASGGYLMEALTKNPMAFASFKAGAKKVMDGAASGALKLVTEGEKELARAMQLAGTAAVGSMRRDDQKTLRTMTTARRTEVAPYVGRGQP